MDTGTIVLNHTNGKRILNADGKIIMMGSDLFSGPCSWVALRDCADTLTDKWVPLCQVTEDPTYFNVSGTCYRAYPGLDVSTPPNTGDEYICDATVIESCSCYYLQARNPCNANALVDVWVKVPDSSGVASDTYILVDGVCYVLRAADTATTSPGTIVTSYTTTTSTDPLCCPPPTCNPLPTGLNASYTVTATVHPMQGGDGQPCGYRCGPSVVNVTVSSAALNPTSWESATTTNLCTFPGNPEPEHSGRITVSFIRISDGFGGYSSCFWQLVWEGDFVGCSMTFRKYTGDDPEGDYYVYRSNSTAVTEADQLAYDCATDGRTRCAMQVDGIQFVSVG